MSIAINPIFPVIGAQGVAAGVVLQPGTVVDATVLKVLDANLVRSAIANLSIDVLSEVPLKPGQALQLAVSQTEQGVKLAIVPQTGDGDGAPALSRGAGPASPVVTPALDEASSAPQPATNVAPNIAASKIAPTDVPVDPRAARPLTNIEALVVSAVAQSAAAKQTSLSPLFANLNVAATLQSLPPALQEAAAKLLAVRPELNTALTGGDVKAAFEKSGLFLEQSLAAKAITTPSTPQATSLAGEPTETPDLKAALIVFRQTVASWLGNAAEPGQSSWPSPEISAQQLAPQAAPQAASAQKPASTAEASLQNLAGTALPGTPPQSGPSASPSIVPQQSSGIQYDEILLPQASITIADEHSGIDPKIQIFAPSEPRPTATARATAANTGLASLQEVLQAFPKGVRDAVAMLLEAETNASRAALNSASGAKPASFVSDATDVPPPPFRGAAPSAQPVAAASLAPDAEPVAVARHLVDDADAAIARQTLLQVASLPDRADVQGLRPDANVPRWNFEIPFATSQGTAVAQFEISRDGGGVSVDPSKKVWRARFSLNVEPTGPVHALVTLSGERTSVRMWAERPSTAAQLRANAPQLTHALREAALEPGDIVIGDGAPPQPAQPSAGHFLDRAL